jgi:prepilin-type N-terminal cleavage/methylation domain-containing protein
MTRRGLTLIEMLASLVLLSMISAACVPLLRSTAAPDPTLNPGFIADLGLFADELMKSPDEVMPVDGEILARSWQRKARSEQVTIQLIPVDDTHGWLMFAVERAVVLRCVTMTPPKAAAVEAPE